MHQPVPTQPHSGLGVASFIASLAAGAILTLVFAIAGMLESRPGGLGEDSTAAGVLGLFMLFTALAQAVALGLGVACLVQAGRNKLYGVLGTVFSATGLIGTAMVLLLGAVLES